MGGNSLKKKPLLARWWGSCCFKGVLAQLALMNVIRLGVAQFIHDYGKRVLLKRKWEGLGLHTSCSRVSSQHAPTPPLTSSPAGITFSGEGFRSRASWSNRCDKM